jgi:serine/threonine-protein kinase
MNGKDNSASYEFGPFRVDVVKRRLIRAGCSIPLTAKAFDTLSALLENAGEVVAKAELMDRVWPDAAVEENNLTQQISALRKVFGERASDHKFIVTVPGRGYCFVAGVRSCRQTPAQVDEQAGSERSVLSGSSSFLGYAIAVLYILVICVPALIFAPRSDRIASQPRSIAIMPFRSAGVGDELLGMGIRDTLRAKLGSLDDVTIRPVSSDVTEANVVDAGRQMHVDVVLTGSVQSDAGRVRVAVEMVDVTNERIMWGNTFDQNETNTFELQDSIAAAVLSALRRPKLMSAAELMRLAGNLAPPTAS